MEKELVILGAGPGGYVAAIRAAQLGKKVCVIEDKYIGGVCLNVGCIPSKALIHAGHTYQSAKNAAYLGVTAEPVLDFTKTQAWKDKKVVKSLTMGVTSLLKKNGVEVLMGRGVFTSKNSMEVTDASGAKSEVKFKEAIIATGSRPIEIKGFNFSERVIDSTGGLNLEKLPESMIVIGGGYIGSELACAYSDMGVKIHVLEGSDAIIPNFETDMTNLVVNYMQKNGATIETNALAKSVTETASGVTVTYSVGGVEKTASSDCVMVTVGRRPNTDSLGLEKIGMKVSDRGIIEVDEKGQTSISKIYAIGDVVPGFALAHKASYEAKVAAESLAGQNVVVDYKAMPAVCFTTPELASVGMSEKEAKATGKKVTASKFPFAVNGRAISMNSTEGFVRLISEENSRQLLGAQIAGANASDLLAELTLAIETGLTVEDLALTIHSHPSLSEVVMDAAELALGFPIHI